MINLAIVICNYNKCEYLLKCIDAVLNSSYKNYDIYVVDNASIDNSVAQVKREFLNKVKLIVNKQNLGGSGGFNTGLREALKKKYKYIMLLDNDAMVEEKSIEKAINYLEENSEVGMLGFKLYSMDNPNQIQEFGADIDFEKFTIKPYYKGYVDDGNMPLVKECDYVPACAMIVRKEAVLKTGLMPEENFIYWDDIEWGYKFKLNNYKVIAYSDSIAWHKMGVKQRTNTFGTYYFWRNRVKFFKEYCNKIQKEHFAKQLFDEMAQSICMCNYNEKYNSGTTILRAVLDALYGINGKADENKIMSADIIKDKFNEMVIKNNYITIMAHTDVNHITNLIERIRNLNKNAKIQVVTNNIEIKKQVEIINVTFKEDEEKISKGDLVIETCDNVFNVLENMNNVNYSYVDKYFNVIYDNTDFNNLKKCLGTKETLFNILYPIIKEALVLDVN